MNTNQFKRAIKGAAGKVQEESGNLIGSKSQQTNGLKKIGWG